MTALDPHLVVRAAAVYIAIVATGFVWMWRKPTPAAVRGAFVAAIWNLPALLALNVAAQYLGWWTFDAAGGLFLGVPVDLWLAWAWLWGAAPAFASPALSWAMLVALAAALDVALMPLATPVVRLGSTWLVGEAVALLAVLVPSQLLARWTARGERLAERAMLQMIAFTGIVLFVLPAIAIDNTGRHWLNPINRPAWQTTLWLQLLAVPAVLGVTAVQEFVTRGRGTPVPFDPPERLVTTGVYAYIRNPMQLSAMLLIVSVGVMLHNAWVGVAGVMAHVYSIGLAAWDEESDLATRFGGTWTAYRRRVRSWFPHARPQFASAGAPSRLYVSEQCEMCREVGEWFARRQARQLEIVPAERHPSQALQRITYESGSDELTASGVAAIARALEHVHLGWALVAFFLRLPIVDAAVQVLVDASGGGPRRLAPDHRCAVEPTDVGTNFCSR